MSDESILPFLSQFDPPEQAEGSLDPLGLYSVADALGVRLAPGVRERQKMPRYLTLALVGFVACGEELAVVGDKKQLPAWLVYEWLVVESLVRQFRGNETPVQGIPGLRKVTTTIDAQDVVCARTYLKTPTVFGFHGIYRVLGLKLGLFDADGHPLDVGYRVLSAWERDQGLTGFVSGSGGPGADFRRAIERSVRSGLEAGYSRDPGSQTRKLIADHLLPHAPGPQERDELWAALTVNDPLRGEYARLLTSQAGQETWLQAGGSEAAFHVWALKSASLPMQQLLKTIQAFEDLARLLTDAFDEMRWRMTLERTPVTAEWLAGGDALKRASQDSLAAYEHALNQLSEIDPGLRARAERALLWIGEANSPAAFAHQLLEHHGRIQRTKPPNGKRAWFDTFGDGRVAIRPAYTLNEFVPKPEIYVQAYRTQPIWSFACDLGRVNLEEVEI
jgi:hypothetical protein